jgi:hypothetical protein
VVQEGGVSETKAHTATTRQIRERNKAQITRFLRTEPAF